MSVESNIAGIWLKGNVDANNQWLSLIDNDINDNNETWSIKNLFDENPETFFPLSPSINKVSNCQASSAGEATIIIKLRKPSCLKSVQVEWAGFQSPQLTSIEIQRIGNSSHVSATSPDLWPPSSWSRLSTGASTGGFQASSCEPNRVDIWNVDGVDEQHANEAKDEVCFIFVCNNRMN